MRVLITNQAIAGRSGTELYAFELATGLAALGHSPVVYGTRLGPLADELRQRSIPVVDHLARIREAPDVIHGHHRLETVTALAAFPSTPALFVCHDCSAWHDAPPLLNRVYRYVAVDQTCRERLTQQHGLASDRVEVIFNAVDMRRFRLRPHPLPATPQRALLFGNYSDHRTLRLLRAACRRRGIHVDASGHQFGAVCERPEQVLGQYDVVFAKGRCAWEAASCGAAVVVCDSGRIGPLVTTANLQRCRDANFGRRLLQTDLDEACVVDRLAQYNAEDVCEVTRLIRATAGTESWLAQLDRLYQNIVTEHAEADLDLASEFRELAGFLQDYTAQHQSLIKQQVARYRPLSVLQRWGRSWGKRVARNLPWLDHALYRLRHPQSARRSPGGTPNALATPAPAASAAPPSSATNATGKAA